MVIQRLQTLWLIIASVLMIVFAFLPVAAVSCVDATDPNSVSFIYPTDMPVFLVVNFLVAALLLINVFMFKNLSRQKTVTLVSMLLIAVLAVMLAVELLTGSDRVEWLGSVFLLFGAFAFAGMAWRGIRSDERLLKAADRLR